MQQFLLTGFVANLFSTNTFILADTVRKSAIVFDAPGAVDRIVDYLKQNGIERVEAVFLTHGHVDHIIAMNEYRKQLPGEWKAYLGEPDLHIWQCVNQQIHDFGVPFSIETIADPDVLLKGGEVFTFGDTTIECILSPGHSLGSIVYVVKRKGQQDLIVTGDVLFSNSMGRTDWTDIAILNGTSSYLSLVQSVKALEKQNQEASILPGHGDCTTLKKALNNVKYYMECLVCHKHAPFKCLN
ncbi:hypothetical protein WA556_005712 [Blastocystis sp. ATCC 50177/Nand II]